MYLLQLLGHLGTPRARNISTPNIQLTWQAQDERESERSRVKNGSPYRQMTLIHPTSNLKTCTLPCSEHIFLTGTSPREVPLPHTLGHPLFFSLLRKISLPPDRCYSHEKKKPGGPSPKECTWWSVKIRNHFPTVTECYKTRCNAPAKKLHRLNLAWISRKGALVKL